MNINNIIFQKEFYNNKKFCVIDNILNIETAKHLQKEIVESLDDNLKYNDPRPFHFGLSHSIPSTLIMVFFLNILVKNPKGPLAELTTSTTSVFEKQTCKKEKKELNN